MARYLSRETEPFGKWKGIPIYLTTVLCGVMVLGLLICIVAQVSGALGALKAMLFVVPRPDWLNVVAAFAYPLIDSFHFFTPFAIFFMYSMSLGIETHLGRVVLSKLYLLLVLLPTVVAAVLFHGMGIPGALAGNFYIACGIVIAFATLYPNAEWFAGIPFKFVAIACVFCGILMALAEKRIVPVLALMANCLAAFFYIRYALEQEYDDAVPLMTTVRGWFRKKPKFRVVPKEDPSTERWQPPVEPESAVSAEVDAILDKVARNGKDSLTPAEKAKLQKASEDFQRRDRR